MRYRFIDENAPQYPVRTLCRVLQVPSASYYQWVSIGRARQREREIVDEVLLKKIETIHNTKRRLYGSPRITDALRVAGTLHPVSVVRSTELPPASPGTPQVNQVKPAEYAIEQNYPNPFNPATSIKYQLPADSKVEITIYNVIGQAVGTLVNTVESAGYKEVTWNAEHAASGLYFCRITATSMSDPAKSFSQIRKMTLIK
jgi:hypothetical protein